MRACEEEPCGWCEKKDSTYKGLEFVLYILTRGSGEVASGMDFGEIEETVYVVLFAFGLVGGTCLSASVCFPFSLFSSVSWSKQIAEFGEFGGPGLWIC